MASLTEQPLSGVSSCYKTTSYTYPNDLITNNIEYGRSYVVFYINVAEDSRALVGGEETTAIGVDRRLQSKISGYSIPTGTLSSGITQLTESLSGLDFSEEVANSNYSNEISAIGSYIDKTATYFFGDSNNLFSRPQKRLKTAIALHTPNDLSIRYSTNWQETSTYYLSAILQGATEAGRGVANAANSSGDAIKSIGSISSLATEVGGGVLLDMFPSASPALGLAKNPKKEQQFSGVDFRSFSFEYVFAPRSEKEAENVQDIIYMFKYHMHPEYKSEHGFLYMYPSEFDIEYYFNGEINTNIHKHTSCVLTDMTIDYTNNQGVMTFFPNGMPTLIRMTLHFKELLQLTKETIALGT